MKNRMGLSEQCHSFCGVFERRIKIRVGILACNVPVREHQASALGPVVSPCGNTRPREHDANPNPRFLASGPSRSLAEKRKNPLVDPVGVFKSDARADCNKTPPREGSIPLVFFEKGDEVGNLVDFSLMEKRIERPLLSRSIAG